MQFDHQSLMYGSLYAGAQGCMNTYCGVGGYETIDILREPGWNIDIDLYLNLILLELDGFCSDYWLHLDNLDIPMLLSLNN